MIFHVITNRIFALHFNLASNSEKSYIRKGSRIENIISIDVQSQEKVSALLLIYALNWPISNIQETIYKMQNSQFFDKFLIKLLANLSKKGLVQKFAFPWILQVVKVRCFQFYLIKCPFFKSQTLKPCKIKVS